MKAQGKSKDPVLEQLDRIGKVLDDILVIECARMGLNKAETKKIVGGDSNRITRIWKHIKIKEE
jgi:hypothetical protein